MFQLIGCLLACFAVISVLAGSLIAGTVFALLTLVWVVFAKPASRDQTVKHVDRWGNVYEAPLGR
jgi:hypothetical protein